MVDKEWLELIILSDGKSHEEIASALGISCSDFNDKISNKKEFYLKELDELQTLLNIPADLSPFFIQCSAKKAG